MRNRSNSGIRLDYYQRLVNKCILRYQNPTTGLLSSETGTHAWVRDNVYCIMSVWGLGMAYRKTADLDEDRAKAYELEQSVVKLMRGLLRCMMLQSEKLERFKYSQSPKDALHAKYCSKTHQTVVGDFEWGHLQIDATSLFLLTLAQMTASGLNIIFTLDEVAFIQNLVFYIEAAYRTPDYGIWERGDKTNHGLPELNSSSIGMAKAALEAMNDLDLFGSRGGPASVIHVLPDEAQQCRAILHSMLPKESSSKEVDAGLLTVIGFPAFAVDNREIIEMTRNEIREKLEGKYGCSRFLRDGYKTPREDSSRLHYEPWELLIFEKIECQWPLFFAFSLLTALFNKNTEEAEYYRKKLEFVVLKSDDGTPIMPELYAVAGDKVDEEYHNPNSTKRNPIGKIPHMWGQSMYILSRLIYDGFLSPGELDPLNRRLSAENKPDVVVQVVILAEDSIVQHKLHEFGIDVQTPDDVAPIQVMPARYLSHFYSRLGKNRRMSLSGRPSSEIGLLATSKLYTYNNRLMVFIPQFLDKQHFYIALDTTFMTDLFRNEVNFMKRSWNCLGRPTITMYISQSLFDDHLTPPPTLIATVKKLQSGYIGGTRVHLGQLNDFLTTSCMTNLNFVCDQADIEHKDPFQPKLSSMSLSNRPSLQPAGQGRRRHGSKTSRTAVAFTGICKRSRSIQIDPEQVADLHAKLQIRKTSGDYWGDMSKLFFRSTSDSGASHTASDASGPGTPEETLPTFTLSPESSSHSHLREPQQEQLTPILSVDSLQSGHVTPVPSVHRMQMDHTDLDEIIESLRDSDNLQEQADIVHYLYMEKGPDFDTNMLGKPCTVKELLVELYEKAGHYKQWWLVRHTAGMLKKRVEDLALAVTDLLVRQKQLSVGLPPEREKIIQGPLPPEEIAAIIFDACGEDASTASLTQELLIYLAMFIRTEPKLFNEMLRLRTGLIVQVMASELARTLKCTGDEASDHLLNLSPFQMKTLLYHILSGKEFMLSADDNAAGTGTSEHRISVFSKPIKTETRDIAKRRLSKVVSSKDLPRVHEGGKEEEEEEEVDRIGQWLRRRRLDGSLNRVPVGFYPRTWNLLKKSHGLSINGYILPSSLTREMTPGEFNFALQVETVLNCIPQPEYRQLMVEALMVLGLMADTEGTKVQINYVIEVDQIVHQANTLFLADQHMTPEAMEKHSGPKNINMHFYDSAPSGRFGTMAYMCRALAAVLKLPQDDCCIS